MITPRRVHHIPTALLALTLVLLALPACTWICPHCAAKARDKEQQTRQITRADADEPAQQNGAHPPPADATVFSPAAPAIDTEDRAGLRIETLREGEGEPVTPDSTVTMRYRAALEDGALINESTEDPVGPWRVAALVSGLRDALIGMRAGGVRRVTVPAEQAYADEPVVDEETGEIIIPADATIVFTIELVSVDRPESTDPPSGETPD